MYKEIAKEKRIAFHDGAMFCHSLITDILTNSEQELGDKQLTYSEFITIVTNMNKYIMEITKPKEEGDESQKISKITDRD